MLPRNSTLARRGGDFSFAAETFPVHYVYMQSSRDSSVWRSLAVAFGDGLAFGVGMKLTQNAASRSSAAPATAANAALLAGRLEQFERRLAEIEQKPPAAPAPQEPFDRRVLEAVVHALETRLQEHAGVVDRRLAEIESKVAAELEALRQQDRTIASGVETRVGELEGHFAGQLEAMRRKAEGERAETAERQRTIEDLRQNLARVRQWVEDDRLAIRQELASAIAASESVVRESLAPIHADAAEKHRAIEELRQKVEESDAAVVDVFNGIGDLIRQAAGRRTVPRPGALTASPAPPAVPELSTAPPFEPAAQAPGLPALHGVSRAEELESRASAPELAPPAGRDAAAAAPPEQPEAVTAVAAFAPAAGRESAAAGPAEPEFAQAGGRKSPAAPPAAPGLAASPPLGPVAQAPELPAALRSVSQAEELETHRPEPAVASPAGQGCAAVLPQKPEPDAAVPAVAQAGGRESATRPEKPEPDATAPPCAPAGGQESAAPPENPEPDAAVPEFAQAAGSGGSWRVALISSVLVALQASGLVMLHYW